MTYAELATHAENLYQNALRLDLEQQQYAYLEKDGKYLKANQPSSLTDMVVGATTARLTYIRDLFDPFLGMPDPTKLLQVRYDLVQVAEILNLSFTTMHDTNMFIGTNDHLKYIDDTKGILASWHGQAAWNFEEKFQSKWEPMASTQFGMVMALAGAVEAERALWESARNDVDTIAHQAQTALDAMQECSPDDISVSLSVVTAIISIAATPLSGGAGLGLTFVGEAIGVGAGLLGESPEVTFGGKSVDEIFKGVSEALNKLKTVIELQEERIAKSVKSAQWAMSSEFDQMNAPRPELADATPENIKGAEHGLGRVS